MSPKPLDAPDRHLVTQNITTPLVKVRWIAIGRRPFLSSPGSTVSKKSSMASSPWSRRFPRSPACCSATPGVISGAIFSCSRTSCSPESRKKSWSPLSCWVGNRPSFGRLADRSGRRKIHPGRHLFIIAAIGTALAPTPAWLRSDVVVVGIAIGIASFTAPPLHFGVSPASIRGNSFR